MKLFFTLYIVLIFFNFSQAQQIEKSRVTSSIDSSISNELVLIQEFNINAGVESVWEAYTTAEGWKNWVAPLVEIDLKIGGQIRANYNSEGSIGDSTTIINNIINYVPERLITLQSEISEHFPEFMKEDAKNFYNVVYFNRVDKNTTNVISYGIGYRNNEKYNTLMKFFISGNELSYMNLIAYLEKGESVKHK